MSLDSENDRDRPEPVDEALRRLIGDPEPSEKNEGRPDPNETAPDLLTNDAGEAIAAPLYHEGTEDASINALGGACVTLIASDDETLSKRVTLGPDGGLVKDSSASILRSGHSCLVSVPTATALAAVVERCERNQAFLYGRYTDPNIREVRISVSGRVEVGEISRTQKHFRYTDGPGWCLVDVDGFPGDPLAALLDTVPALANSAYVVRRSTTFGIKNARTGAMFRGGGWHISILLERQLDLPRFLEDLHKRLWLKGYGWIKLSAAGTMLERSPVDLAMRNQVQPIFEGAPDLGPGLAQELRPAIAHDGEALDTVRACPPLSAAEGADYGRLVIAHKTTKSPEAARVRETWTGGRVAAFVARGMTESAARAALSDAADRCVLPPLFELHFMRFGVVTVADVLADPETYIGQRLADPHEGPEYGVGPAIVYREPEGLWISSFAHGGMEYHFEREARLEDVYEPGELAGQVSADALEPKAAEVETFSFSASKFKDMPREPRRWLVPNLIPDRNVSAISGDGGVGKSLIALQAAVAAVLGRDWLGMPIKPGPVVFFSAEDDNDELHNRLADIAAAEGFDLGDLDDLHIIPRAGLDAVLGVADVSGVIKPTALWAKVERDVDKIKPVAVVFDTRADIFAGNENDRPEARQFVGILRSLAIRFETAVLLLEHPSQQGMNTGSGTSGSTAWNNSVRSRLYLERPKGEKDRGRTPDLRSLTTKKQNYAAGVDDERLLRWDAGRFVAVEKRVVDEADADGVFLSLLDRFIAQKRDISPEPRAAQYAPKFFAEQPEAKAEGLSEKAMKAAMERLFAEGAIVVDTYGPPSKKWRRIKKRG